MGELREGETTTEGDFTAEGDEVESVGVACEGVANDRGGCGCGGGVSALARIVLRQVSSDLESLLVILYDGVQSGLSLALILWGKQKHMYTHTTVYSKASKHH